MTKPEFFWLLEQVVYLLALVGVMFLVVSPMLIKALHSGKSPSQNEKATEREVAVGHVPNFFPLKDTKVAVYSAACLWCLTFAVLLVPATFPILAKIEFAL